VASVSVSNRVSIRVRVGVRGRFRGSLVLGSFIYKYSCQSFENLSPVFYITHMILTTCIQGAALKKTSLQ